MQKWVKGLPDNKGALEWDSKQFTIQLVVNSALTLGVVDTGSCVIWLDTKMAEELGLLVKQVKPIEFRCYIVL